MSQSQLNKWLVRMGASRSDEPNGYGVYFFPSLSFSRPTSKGALIIGNSYSPRGYKAFETYFKEHLIIVNKDGLIAVDTHDKALALKILNTVMGVGILDGLDLFAVREHELIHVRLDLRAKLILAGRRYKSSGNKKHIFCILRFQTINYGNIFGNISRST